MQSLQLIYAQYVFGSFLKNTNMQNCLGKDQCRLLAAQHENTEFKSHENHQHGKNCGLFSLWPALRQGYSVSEIEQRALEEDKLSSLHITNYDLLSFVSGILQLRGEWATDMRAPWHIKKSKLLTSTRKHSSRWG